MILFYVRHGDPIYNPDYLTELGKKQAEALVSRMKECNPDKIYASSSNRAIMTAQPTVKALNKEIEILDWCNEGYAWRDLSIKEDDGSITWCFYHSKMKKILASNEVRKLDKLWYDHPAFDEYSFKSGYKRIHSETEAFMLSLGYKHDDENNGYIAIKPNSNRIALFAHQVFCLTFLSCLLDIPFPQMTLNFDMSHSNVTTIYFDENEKFVKPKVLQMSNDSHLFAAGIPTNYNNIYHF